MILFWLVLSVQVGLPFQLGTVGKMIQSVTHCIYLSLFVMFGSVAFYLEVFWDGRVNANAEEG